MAEAPERGFYEVLERARRGQATDREVADALAGLEALVVIPTPGDLTRFLGDLDRKLEETGRPVRMDDAPAPSYVGATTEAGEFVPLVFTTNELAREHAVTSGLVDPGDAVMTMTSPPASRLWECLQSRWGGMVLDPGCDQELRCDRRKVAQLWGLMTLEGFARSERLWLLFCQGRPITQSAEDGRGTQAFVFDSQGAADHGARLLQPHAPGAEAVAMAPAELLRGLLRLGVADALVDVGAPWARTLPREELVRALGWLEPAGGAEAGADASPNAGAGAEAGSDAAGAGAGSDAAAAAARALGLDPALRPEAGAEATRAPDPAPAARPAVAPPGRGDDASIAAFEAHEAAYRKHESLPTYVQALAFDQDLYLPVNPQRGPDGLLWPMRFRHPRDEGRLIAHTTTSRSVLEAWMAEAPPEHRQLLHLSGVEALRWIWALPEAVDEIGVDFGFPGRNGTAFAAVLALCAFFPLWNQHADLAPLPAVAAGRLGALPGARGLRPQALRALVRGWRDLVAVAGPDGAPPAPVEHAGRRCLPAFTGPEPFLSYGSAHPDFAATPRPAGAEPPFGRWLREARGCDGVVLDPGSAAPLVLEHVDLLGLDLYARPGDAPPRGRDVMQAIAALHAAEPLPDRLLGRLVAEWPSFYLCFTADNQGLVLPVPDMDCCPVFTSAEQAESYLLAHRNLGIFQGTEGMEPRQAVHRAGRSAFHFVLSQYRDGLWIDPVALGAGGIHLAGDALLAARDRVDEELEPRVPGFRDPAAG